MQLTELLDLSEVSVVSGEGVPCRENDAELWFADRTALEAASHTPEMEALHADGAKFIGRIKSYIVEEKTIVG